MNAGFECFNENGDLLISSSQPNLYVHTIMNNVSNTTSPYYVTIPYSGWPETPTLLIKPRADVWYGQSLVLRDFDDFTGVPKNSIRLYMGTEFGSFSGPYDLAVASTAKAVPSIDIENYGLQVFDENEDLIFSSARKYPRIKQIAAVAGPDLTIFNYTTAAPITAEFDDMPWVIFRDAVQSIPFDSAGTVSGVGFIFKINSDRSLISVKGTDTTSNGNNQYWGRNLHFPLCEIPGL